VPSFFRFAQHTPVHFTDIVSGGHIEYVASHMLKCCTLERLGKEVFSVGQYATFTSPCFMQLVTKKVHPNVWYAYYWTPSHSPIVG